MKILVTGGNGFLGSWIVRALARENEVHVLHRKTSDLSSLTGVPYTSVLGDVTDFESVRTACSRMEAVFHVAAVISYAPSEYETMRRVNVEGTANVVRAAREAGVRRLVHTSSVVAVGATPFPKVLNENSPFELGPYRFGYYDTKREAENIVREAVKNHELDAVIVNPSIMFGAGDAVKSSRKTHLKVARGRFPFYPSGGVNIMHVEDAVEGHLKALERGRAGERYILGGENVLIREMFEMLARAGGSRPPPIAIPGRLLRATYKWGRRASALGIRVPSPSDQTLLATMFHWYDISKAKKELGLNPRPAVQAIEESIEWSRQNGYLSR